MFRLIFDAAPGYTMKRCGQVDTVHVIELNSYHFQHTPTAFSCRICQLPVDDLVDPDLAAIRSITDQANCFGLHSGITARKLATSRHPPRASTASVVNAGG
mmetsp:Transcript_38056/g.77793  ORF Transcript_38056/g.77793 Transcript_38056/m.77793 type:complete len:101 (-) Transcript_38056:12-314(-)